MVTVENKNRIMSVINIFETGSADGKYDDVTIYDDGKPDANGKPTRQITYGRSQTTEQSHLRELIESYIANNGQFAADFQPYVSQLGIKSLVDDSKLIALLKKAAREDDIMCKTQDVFFDKVYYQPALKFFNDNKFTLPLSMLVIYDSYIHSGKIRDDIRNTFPESPPVRGGDEKAWVSAYVKARTKWLSGRSNPKLRETIYRTQCFSVLIALGDWMLENPVSANGMMSRDMEMAAPIDLN